MPNTLRTLPPFLRSCFSALLVLSLFTACGVSHYEDRGRPYFAEVIAMVPKTENDTPSTQQTYKIQKIQFKNLENLETLSHRYFDTWVGGKASLFMMRGKTSSSPFNPRLYLSLQEANLPVLHYKINEGVIVPQNNDTLISLSTVYQLDTLIDQLETLTGISSETLFGRKKFQLIHHTKRRVDNDWIKNDNAAYEPNSILTFRPSSSSTLPMGANLDVLSHEFGHFIYHEYLIPELLPLLLSKFPETSITPFVTKGFDEGFADLFTYTFTGNSNAVAGSLRTSPEAHQRDFTSVDFDGRTMPQKCTLGYYCIGVLFNFSYYQTQLALGSNPRSKTERSTDFIKLVRAYKKAGPEIFKNLRESAVTPLTQDSESNSKMARQVFRDYINPLLNAMDDERFKNTFKYYLNLSFPDVLSEESTQVDKGAK